MKEDVRTLIDEVFLRWSGYNPDLADKSAAKFIEEYNINDGTTFDECNDKLIKFKHRMDVIRSMMA